ncbi:1703_t:CDS:2 [Diversispora eburnea]|uniref:1703_t:CDS:1 n=2 Tax=Diversisporales TaxID=214509 RepID=A0A9N8Z7B0_9GLOM|nr:1703_t:CDS:2 [Diversispora eburnea]
MSETNSSETLSIQQENSTVTNDFLGIRSENNQSQNNSFSRGGYRGGFRNSRSQNVNLENTPVLTNETNEQPITQPSTQPITQPTTVVQRDINERNNRYESGRHHFRNKRDPRSNQNTNTQNTNSETNSSRESQSIGNNLRNRSEYRGGRGGRSYVNESRTSPSENQGISEDSSANQIKDNVVKESLREGDLSSQEYTKPTGSKDNNVSENRSKVPKEKISSSPSTSSSSNQKTFRNNNRSKISSKKVSLDEIKDVRTSITHGLTTSTYECMICCEVIRPYSKTWYCGVCWAVFHLQCTQKWAQKSVQDVGSWRCPGCQHRLENIPEVYKCFCGKVENPQNSRYFTPHSCGEICRRKRDCPHDCTQLCHPGPCDRTCSAMGPVQPCFCGREKFQLRCVDTDYSGGRSCGTTCGKLLGCEKHYCEQDCHDGSCKRCDVVEIQKCYCGQTEREAKCGEGNPIHCYRNSNDNSDDWTGFFSCDCVCSRLLDCGKHYCDRKCHSNSGEAEPCLLDPSRVKNCPCGARSIEELLGCERMSCTEKIPLCGNPCRKSLMCGHSCTDVCHYGECKPCTVKVRIKCRCGSTEFEKICSEVTGKSGEPPLCEKICKMLRNCRKHECNTKCCPSANIKQKHSKRRFIPQEEEDLNHICTLICGKKLQCGKHNCQLLCHSGPCMRCLEATFEELSCHCGQTKIYPPIPCGMEIPKCEFPCTRIPPCNHAAVTHNCHPDSEPCPPCPYLVNNKKCICGKSTINNVRCHKTNVSCGKECDRPLYCGGHRCRRLCHSGDCLDPQICNQICGKPRKDCGHPCTSTCHAPSRCPEETPCLQKITINCKCGNLSREVTCNSTVENPADKDRQLDCNDFCAMIERNRKLADALELSDRIVDGNLIKEIPEYDTFLLQYYETNKEWAKNIENTLTEFIKSVKPTLNFSPMKSSHRHFIHGLCVHYRLTSESVDVEPYRSIIVKKKSDSTIPPILLSQTYAKYGKMGNQSLANVSSSSSITTPEQSIRKPKQPVNALYLVELNKGLTKEELQKNLDSLLGKIACQTKWINDEDVIIIPFVGSMQMNDLEALLMKLKLSAKDILISKGIVGNAELCWVNSKYEVTWRERSKLLNNRGSKVTAVPSSISIDNKNSFEMLMNVKNYESSHTVDSWDADIDNSKNNSSKQLPVNITSEDNIVDDWELLSDNE